MRKIFDVHTHVWPDKIAAAVLVHLQKKSCDLPVYTDGTYGGLKAKAEEAGYTAERKGRGEEPLADVVDGRCPSGR